MADEKIRVALTLPRSAVNAFKKDARSLNLTLSSYVYLLLASNSSNLDPAESLMVSERLDFLFDCLHGRDQG